MSSFRFQPLRVAFTCADPSQAQMPVAELLAALPASPLLAYTEPETAALRVEMLPDATYYFYRRGEDVALAAFRIPVKKLQALPRKLVRLLEHVAAFDNLLNLQPASDALSNVLEVEFLQLETPASGSRPAEVRPLPRDPQGQLQIQAGRNLAIALRNRALTPVHVYVTVFDERQCSVGLVYPYQPDSPARLRPSESVLVGSGPRYLLQMQLPEEAETAVDRFKIWVSATGMQPGIMAMPPLGQRLEPPSEDPYGSGSRLDREVRLAILGKAGSTPMPAFAEDPWWCMEQAVKIVA
ncbi:hypothetical protein NW814_09910 [Synechococcus sp. R65.1]|uniref:hypothetical protein n=1 Tax=Synechococcus sp. R65.1 TaxID=2964524 RepID=UPI0039C0F2FC